MSTSAETNTVLVSLPASVELQLATDALKRFGEVSHVEVLPGSKPILSVVFFDVRAASAARSALGDDRCKVGPQTGNRIAYLPSKAQISVSNLRSASSMKPDPSGCGGFEVEFFDTRDAKRLQDLVEEIPEKMTKTPPGLGMPPGLEPPPGLCLPAVPAASSRHSEDQQVSDAVPAYVKLPDHVDVASPTSEQPATVPLPAELADAASANPEHTEVLLTELPKSLCVGSYLETMLEQAGLEEYILSCVINSGPKVGEARLIFSTRRSAKKCVNHFGGRGWDLAGSPVIAKILTPKTEKPKTEKPKKDKKRKEPVEQQEFQSQAKEQAQIEEAMSHFFASEVGQKLLHDQCKTQICETPEMVKEGTTGINWDEFEDWSDDEQQKVEDEVSTACGSTFSTQALPVEAN